VDVGKGKIKREVERRTELSYDFKCAQNKSEPY
jgi:hypothetical protein